MQHYTHVTPAIGRGGYAIRIMAAVSVQLLDEQQIRIRYDGTDLNHKDDKHKIYLHYRPQ